MDREINIRILPDGKVEIDSTVFNDCTEVANHLSKHIGQVESFRVKEEHDHSDSKLDKGVKVDKSDG